MKFKKNKTILIAAITVLSLIVPCEAQVIENNSNFISTGHAELDKLRKEVKLYPTNSNNVAQRRSSIYRLWRLLWRQGIDMSAFDSAANNLIILDNDNKMINQVIDNGFKTLERIISNPRYINEVKGLASKTSSSTTNWPVYHGVDGSQNGYSPDKGAETGEVVWKFPKTNGWDASVHIKNGKVYTTGAGSDVIAYCLNQKTGEVIWKGRRITNSFYHSPSATKTSQITNNSLIVSTGAYLNSYDLETGKNKYSRIFHKKERIEKKSEHLINNFFDNLLSCNDSETGILIWRFIPKTKILGEPLITENAVYTSTFGNICYKLNKENGKIIWKKKFNNNIRGQLSYADNKILIAFKSGKLIALDPEKGDQIWSFKPKNQEPRAYEFFGSSITSEGRIYIGAANKHFYCLDAETGLVIWNYKADDWIRSKPVLVDKVIYFADLSGTAYALNASKKKAVLNWKQKISDHGFTADLKGDENGILLSDRNMILTSVDIKTGEIKWKHSQLDGAWIDGKFFAAGEVSGQQSSPTVVDGILYIASPDGFVNAIDESTGKEIWKFETKSSCSPSPTVYNGKVFVGQTYQSFDTYFALDKNTGEPIWETQELGSVWVSAAFDNGKLFLGNKKGDFFAINPDTGKKIWNYFTAKNTPNENKPLKGGGHGWPPGVYCNPVTENNVVYTGSWSGYYFAFKQDTGELLWRCKTQADGADGGVPDSAAPVLHKDHLYVQKQGKYISAINKYTGKIEWEWESPIGFLQNGTIAANDNMIFGSAARHVTTLPYNTTIYAFKDVENGGDLIWQHKGGGGLTAPVITNNKLIFGSSGSPFITCLNPKTGKMKWRTYVGGMMLESVPAIYGDKVFALVKSGYLYAFK